MIPESDGIMYIFKSNKANSNKEIIDHCDLVWSESDFGTDTPKYFRNFKTAPTNTTDLDVARNGCRLRHVMMGGKIWNSLSSNFKIDITGSVNKFQRGQENDGPLLWDFIRRRINPTTTVGASKLKDEIKAMIAASFENNIVKYNTWFKDMRDRILKEEGEGYNKYLRSMFHVYLASDNTEFVDTIKNERRRWTQGKLGADYTYLDLMELGRLTYNNLIEKDSWNGKPAKSKDAEKNYLALATELISKFNRDRGDNGKPSGGQINGSQKYG